MTLQSELRSLKLADLLAIRSLADLYSVQAADYAYLQFLSKAGPVSIEQHWNKEERENLVASGFALRAVIRVAETKPLPSLHRFLRSMTEKHDLDQALEYGPDLPLTVLPIVEEAMAQLCPESGEPLDDLTRLTLIGTVALFPLLCFLASRSGGRHNSEASL